MKKIDYTANKLGIQWKNSYNKVMKRLKLEGYQSEEELLKSIKKFINK
jgi:hypothetical protein